jgi:hypothetical protein
MCAEVLLLSYYLDVVVVVGVCMFCHLGSHASQGIKCLVGTSMLERSKHKGVDEKFFLVLKVGGYL